MPRAVALQVLHETVASVETRVAVCGVQAVDVRPQHKVGHLQTTVRVEGHYLYHRPTRGADYNIASQGILSCVGLFPIGLLAIELPRIISLIFQPMEAWRLVLCRVFRRQLYWHHRG